MIPVLSLENFLSWVAQVSVLALAGVILPAIFRIRHPRSQLAYCYGLLLACLVLPLIQPWQHPVVSGANGSHPELLDMAQVVQSTRSASNALEWKGMMGWTLVAGIVARLCWILAGLWQINRYRTAAVPIRYFPESVRLARNLTKRHAAVYLSANNIGPVAFGWFDPVVLLPESFLSMEHDAQCAIVCHELLHVKRNDWLVTVIEEFVGACLGFHPTVWWLLSQTKLAREQIVDAEVIRLTAAPDPYIDALLSMAGVCPDRSLLRAPSFLSKRHLIRRLRSLLIDSPVSTLRLIWSYASMAGVLVITGCLAFASFPLMGRPQIREAVVPEAATSPAPSTAMPAAKHSSSMEGVFRVGGGVTAPKLITHVDPEYSNADKEALTQGTVVVQGIVQTDGSLSVARVLRSLNPELDRNAILAMTQWRFEPGKLKGTPVPVELDIEVNFTVGAVYDRPRS